MDSEILDDSQNSLPEEAKKEIKSMCKWMSFTAVMLIIFAIFSVLGNLSNFSSTGNLVFLFSILMNGVSIYFGFMVLRKSGFFNEFSDNNDDEKLVAALNLNRIYWMASTLILIFSILFTLINR